MGGAGIFLRVEWHMQPGISIYELCGLGAWLKWAGEFAKERILVEGTWQFWSCADNSVLWKYRRRGTYSTFNSWMSPKHNYMALWWEGLCWAYNWKQGLYTVEARLDGEQLRWLNVQRPFIRWHCVVGWIALTCICCSMPWTQRKCWFTLTQSK